MEEIMKNLIQLTHHSHLAKFNGEGDGDGSGYGSGDGCEDDL